MFEIAKGNLIRSVAILCLLWGGMARGQADPQPRLILNTFGPTARLRAMEFSRDSRRLFAGGMDKVVHAWEVGWNAQAENGGDRITHVRALRWEIARGNRGVIYSMAVCPTRDELAIAGVSTRQDTGDIAIFNLQQDEVLQSLPTPQARRADPSGSGHEAMVFSLDYSPSGNQLASATETGELLVWQRAPDGSWRRRQIVPPGPRHPYPPPAVFTGENRLVYGVPLADGNYKLRRHSLDTGREVEYPEIYRGRIGAVARSNETYWASADSDGNINLTAIDDENRRRLIRSRQPHVTALAFGPGNLLAIASNEYADGTAGLGVVELWDAERRVRLDEVVVSNGEPVMTVAISPDGQFLATDNEDEKDVVVFRLRNPDGSPIANPLSGTPPMTTGGLGDVVESVAVSADGQAIAFGTSSDQLQHQLNRQRAVIEPFDPEKRWLVQTESNTARLGGWQADHDAYRIRFHYNGVERAIHQLAPEFQGPIRTLCFIPNAQNPNEPVAIAVGTESVDSIFIYSLPGPSGELRLLRWFRDHTGPVNSLAVTPDGKLLVSGSDDQTVKLWSLKDLFFATPSFPDASAWGASFRIQNRQVVAEGVIPEGISYGRGFRNGDVVTRVQGWHRRDNRTLIDAPANRVTPEQTLQTLQDVSLLRQVLINARAGAEQKAFIIRPAWEPLLTAYVDQRGEWAIWNPVGYFNASAAEGGEIFGWQLNQGPDRPPVVMKADFFQKEFEKPEVISQLLAGADVAGALRAVGANQQTVADAADDLPKVKIVSPIATEQLGGEAEVSIAAEVRFPPGQAARFDVRASVDGRRLGQPDAIRQADGYSVYSWSTRPRGLLNRIEVLATERGNALASYYASDEVFRRGSKEYETPIRLSLLTLASENYRGGIESGDRDSFGKLSFPLDDATAFSNLLSEKQQQGLGHYDFGYQKLLKDEMITQEAVKNEIERFNAAVAGSEGFNEWLIVFLSGHGKSIDQDYFYITTAVESSEPAHLERVAIPWSLIDKAGAGNCRVVYMIDTCHSGIAAENFARQQQEIKSSIRNGKRSQGIVIAAASGDKPAKELPELGHGCFTYAVLAALNGEADRIEEIGDRNGMVSLHEVIKYVEDEVPYYSDWLQQPTTSPRRLEELDLLRTEIVEVSPTAQSANRSPPVSSR